jgi:pimeloyl-ACP methyl ester carboxylesterase
MACKPSGRIFPGAAALLCALLLATYLVPSARAQSETGTSSAGLFYEVSGAGDPLVFIHAFSVDRRIWEPQVAAFQNRFRVIRYDLRGHGRSAAPSGPSTSYEDLRSVLDALGINRATLVGLSAGTEVATDFALVYPDRVARLVLAAPGLGGYVLPPLTWAQGVFQAAAAGDAERAATLWAETPIMAMRKNVAAASTVTSLVMSNSRLWTFRRTEQRLSPPAIKRLSEIKCPVLVIVGDQDLVHVKDVASLLTSGIAGAKLVTVPGAGHIVNLDAPAPFNDAVAAFLNSQLPKTQRPTRSSWELGVAKLGVSFFNNPSLRVCL